MSKRTGFDEVRKALTGKLYREHLKNPETGEDRGSRIYYVFCISHPHHSGGIECVDLTRNIETPFTLNISDLYSMEIIEPRDLTTDEAQVLEYYNESEHRLTQLVSNLNKGRLRTTTSAQR